MKSLKQIREASGGKEAYQKFFNSLLKKYGVKSPSELDDKQKKKFYDEIDAGWESDDPNDKNERYEDPEGLNPETDTDSDEDMADKAASKDAGPIVAGYGKKKMNAAYIKSGYGYKKESVKEAKKLKPGKGKAELDINWDGDRKDIKFATTKYKIKMKPHSDGAIISGDKAKLLAYLQGQDYAMDPEDIEDLYPELMESSYPKPLSIIRQVNEFSGDAETVRRKRRRFESEEEEAHKMNEKMVMCEHCGKMHEEGACGDMEEAKAPRLSSAHKNQIHKIARKHSGDMEKAIKEIEKMKIWAGQGIKDNPYVMDVLRQHNEDVNEAMSKGQMAHDKEYMHKKLKGNNDKSMKITTAKALKIKVDGDTLVLTPKQDKLAQKHKVTIRNDKDGDISVWGKGDDVHKFMAAMGQKVEEVEEKVDVDGRLIGFKSAQRRAEGEKQKGKVIVDRRTKGYKEAKLRSEKAKAKREAKKKDKEFAEKYPKLDYAYGDDAELRKTMEAASEVMGYKKKDEDAAANSVASGNVDMAPNMGKKKKKDKEELMARRSY